MSLRSSLSLLPSLTVQEKCLNSQEAHRLSIFGRAAKAYHKVVDIGMTGVLTAVIVILVGERGRQ